MSGLSSILRDVVFGSSSHEQKKEEKKEEKQFEKQVVVEKKTEIKQTAAEGSAAAVSSKTELKQKEVLVDQVQEEIILQQKAPVLKETVLIGEREEIQPVVYREREQTEIHEVTQPMFEREVLPTKVEERMLAAEVRAEQRASTLEAEKMLKAESDKYHSTKTYAATQHQTIVKPAIVHETVKKNIVEEIQPVIYKETVQPVIIKETKPIYEKVVEAPKVVTEIRAPIIAESVKHKKEIFEEYNKGTLEEKSTGETVTKVVEKTEVHVTKKSV